MHVMYMCDVFCKCLVCLVHEFDVCVLCLSVGVTDPGMS